VFVVLPDTHALCAKDTIVWEDLQDETFILSRLGRGFAIHDYVIQRLAALELRPNIRQSPVARDTLMQMVALGRDQSDERSNNRHALSACGFSPHRRKLGCAAVQRGLAAAQQQPGIAPFHQPRPHALEDLESAQRIHRAGRSQDEMPPLILGALCLGKGPIARHEARDHRRDELCWFNGGVAGFLGEGLDIEGKVPVDSGGKFDCDLHRSVVRHGGKFQFGHGAGSHP
jgi:hypothetical protein